MLHFIFSFHDQNKSQFIVIYIFPIPLYHFLQVSRASSKTNLSESSKQNVLNLGQSQILPTETPSLAHDSTTLSIEKLELPVPAAFDPNKMQSDITFANQSSSPQEKDEKLSFLKQSENCDLVKPSSVTPDSPCQTTQDCPDDQIIISSETVPTTSGSGSPQLDQLLSDLEEMKLKFRPETLDLPLSESSDESPEYDQSPKFEDLSPEDPTEDINTRRVCVSSLIQLEEDTYHTNVSVTEPAHFQTFIQDEPEIASVSLDQSPETHDPPLSKSSQDNDQFQDFEYLSSEDPTENIDTERVAVSSVIQLARDTTNDTNVVGTEPSHLQTSVQDEPERVSVCHGQSPETHDTLLSESSYKSPEEDQIRKFVDFSPEDLYPTEDIDTKRVSMSSVTQLTEDTNHTNLTGTVPAHFQTSIQDEPEIVLDSPDHTEISETSVSSSLGSCQGSNLSPTDSLSIFESSERLCEVMEPSLNSSFPLKAFQSSKCTENVTETYPPETPHGVATKGQSQLPEVHQVPNLFEEHSTTDILKSKEGLESAISSIDSKGLTEEISTQSTQYQLPTLREAPSFEATQSEDISSQSLSDLTPETVTSARHFSFEELMPYPSSVNLETSSEEDRTRASGQHSEESLTPVDSECFASQPSSVKAEMTSSTSDEEYSIPLGYEETCSPPTCHTDMPPEYSEVVNSGVNSPTFEYSDPEPYFDCKQAASDSSETEPDEPEPSTRARVLEKVNRRVLLSSGSEDYEDAPFVHEPLYNLREEDEDSDEEFTLCEASKPPSVCEVGAYDDTDKYLTRVR